MQIKTTFSKYGFTLIELLTAAACIGLLVSVAIAFFANAHLNVGNLQRLNDDRRLTDATQIRTGMDLFLTNAGGYPDSALWVSGKAISCDQNPLIQVPHDPSGAYTYIYKSSGTSSASSACGGKVWSNYSFQFQTEGDTSLGLAGIYCLTPGRGITTGLCPK